MQPDISIVIPMRNESSYIGETLSNFRAELERSAFSHEIVIVDGASTDDSLDHCTLADKVIVEREDERSSIARARNIGAENSSGHLIFHTDADVRIPKGTDFFDHLVKTFGDPAVAAVTGRIVPYPWDSRLIDRLWHAVGNHIIRRSHAIGVHFGRGEFQVVRADVFESVDGYNQNITVGEDWDLFRRVSAEGIICYARELFVYHSPRRFAACGYSSIMLTYIRECVFLLIFKRSYLKEWKVVR